jgi:hypothetical protein
MDIFGFLRSDYHLIYIEADTLLVFHQISNLWDMGRGRRFNNREVHLEMPHRYNLQATGQGSKVSRR